jgi:hypothetical protein
MESEILMYVVAKAIESTGTTVTMASAQGDLTCVRFALDEHLSDMYEVGDETTVTVTPRTYCAPWMPTSSKALHSPAPALEVGDF